MIGVVNVVCPQCSRQFLVPEGAPETLCPGCDEHIVWRECLRTRQVFPVLSRWSTWEHPGCTAVHAVDLNQPAAPQEPETPAPIVADRAMWLDEDVRGSLFIDEVCIAIVPAGADPVIVAPRSAIRTVEITSSEELQPAESGDGPWQPVHKPEQRAPRGARLVVELDDGSATIDALVDPAVLRKILQ